MLSNTRNLRSHGCLTCIRRRVKCDEKRPACHRCVQGGRVCAGYRTWDDLVLRHHQVVPTAHDSWQQEALPCFLAYHTTSAMGLTPGHMSFLPDLVASELNRTECFTDALMAAATICLSRHAKTRYPKLEIEATKLNGRALRSTRAALSNPRTVELDTTLAAVILLSTAGIIAGNVKTATSPHHRAEVVLAQLQSKREPSFDTSTGQMLQFVRIQAATRSTFFPRTAHPFTFDDYLGLEGSKHLRGNFFLQSSHVCASLRAADASPEDAQEALRLLIKLQGFYDHLPAQLQYSTVRHDGKQAHIFCNPVMAGSMAAMWSAGLRLLEALQAYNSMTKDSELQQHAENICDPTSIAQKILACTPFMLGEIDNQGNAIADDHRLAGPGPMLLSANLFVVGDVACAKISPEQRLWILDRLAYIGHARGVGQALVFRDDLLHASPIAV